MPILSRAAAVAGENRQTLFPTRRPRATDYVLPYGTTASQVFRVWESCGNVEKLSFWDTRAVAFDFVALE